LLRIFFSLILFFLVSQTDQYKTIADRTINVLTEVSQGNFEHAGARLEIFRTAIEITRHFPFGVGTDNFRNGGKAVIIFDGIINYDKIIVKDKYDNVFDYEDLKSIRFKKSDSKDKYDIHHYRYLQSFNEEDGSLKFTSRWRHAKTFNHSL
jgi:hypothetical protein